MTDKTIRRVRELDAAATKGPWKGFAGSVNLGHMSAPHVAIARADSMSSDEAIAHCPSVNTKRDKDAALIVYYRTAAPLLATALEEQMAMLKEAEGALLEAQRERDALQGKLDAYEPPPRDRGSMSDQQSTAADAERGWVQVATERAHTIRDLKAENKRLREALKHISIQDNEDESSLDRCDAHTLAGALRHCGQTARSALAKREGGG